MHSQDLHTVKKLILLRLDLKWSGRSAALVAAVAAAVAENNDASVSVAAPRLWGSICQ